MSEDETTVADLSAARKRFLSLVEDIRPDLHRYCARMVGSVMDGEDIVQDALARAYYELSALKQLPALRAWLFRIAHNRALDYLRRYDHRMREPLDAALDVAADTALNSEDNLIREKMKPREAYQLAREKVIGSQVWGRMTETVVLFTEYLEDDDEGHRRGDRDCCVKLRNAPDQQVTLRFNREGVRKGRLDEVAPLPVELSREKLSGPEQLDRWLDDHGKNEFKLAEIVVEIEAVSLDTLRRWALGLDKKKWRRTGKKECVWTRQPSE